MNHLDKKYKYLVYTYENEYKEKLGWGLHGDYAYQGIFDTKEKAEAYAEMLKKNGYNRVTFVSVPYFGEE